MNDTIDLCDNEIAVLDNFPLLPRLRTLLLCNNRIHEIATRLGSQLPGLETLVLTNNTLAQLMHLEPLRACTQLRYLSLLDNPIVHVEHYRLWVVWRLPQLRVVDFTRIKEQERVQAKQLFGDKRPNALAKSILSTFHTKTVETRAKAQVDHDKIRAAIQQATSLDDIKRLEALLKAGRLPTEEE
jgi:U2 small nuclear ribonucleoprotein A'